MKHILITGGCGFVGASLAFSFREAYPDARILCLDNLKRRGGELNIPRLQARGIDFLHGDIRNPEDLEAAGAVDLLVECSAEPSVLAGYGTSPAYLVNTNLTGAIHCMELARRRGAAVIFLSTSRVYPYDAINALAYTEGETRFEPAPAQALPGIGPEGIGEHFPLDGPRSLYGATKLASELILQEYAAMYGVPTIINRCGVLTGPWQFGKVDQGVVVLWVARHFWQKGLSYIGFGGQGKQVRDMLHVEDLFRLLQIQLQDLSRHTGAVYNVGGGRRVSLSLLELTRLCQEVTGHTIPIHADPENRPADIRWFVTDTTRVRQATGWEPVRTPRQIVGEIFAWIKNNEAQLKGILG